MSAEKQSAPEPQALICTCEQCGRRYAYDFRKGHTKRKCNSCRNGRRSDRRALKQRMVDYKGGRCEICGYDRCLRALDFHHRDPATKRFTIAHGHNRSWESLRLELDKCLLVCSNCHLEIEGSVAHNVRPRQSDPEGTSKCDRCGRRFTYKPRKGMTRNRCSSCRTNRASPEARRALKEWMIEYKGGACQLCGYRDHWAALTFHHVDPRLKRFNIAGSHGRKLETLREEIDRCVLVCANCHDEIEDGARSVPLDIAARIRTLTDHLPRMERRPPGRPRAR
jgi:hypothetical protein